MFLEATQQTIAIIGEAAVGKKTLIKKIIAGDLEIRKKLGIFGEIRAFGPSFEPINEIKDSTAPFNIYQWQVRDQLDVISTFDPKELKIIVFWRPLDSYARDTWMWDYSARSAVHKHIGSHDGDHYAFIETHHQKIRDILTKKWRHMIEMLEGHKFEVIDCRDYSTLPQIPLCEPPRLSSSGQYFTIADDFRPCIIPKAGHVGVNRTHSYVLPGERSDSNAQIIRKWHLLKPYFHLLKGKTVVDVGANNGFFSAQAAYYGAKSVLAIEKAPKLLLKYVASIYQNMRQINGEFPEINQKCDWLIMLAVIYDLKMTAADVIQLAHETCHEGCIIELCKDYRHKIGYNWKRENFEEELWSTFKNCYLIGTMPGISNPNNTIRYIYLASKHVELEELLDNAYRDAAPTSQPS